MKRAEKKITQLPVKRRSQDPRMRRLYRAVAVFSEMYDFEEKLQAIYYLVHRFLGRDWWSDMPRPERINKK